MPALSTVTSIWQTGNMSTGDVLAVSESYQGNLAKTINNLHNQCMDACNSRCTDIHSVIAQALLEST
jgi:exosome complex component MTR3